MLQCHQILKQSIIWEVVIHKTENIHLTLPLVAFGGWSLVRDRTNRNHCAKHKIWSCRGGVVVDENGRSTAVYHIIIT